MRTTLTIDDDVAAELDRLRNVRDAAYKDLVNEALRLGLQQMTRKPAKPRKRFVMRTVDLGRCRLPNVDNIAEVLAFAEGEGFK